MAAFYFFCDVFFLAVGYRMCELRKRVLSYIFPDEV